MKPSPLLSSPPPATTAFPQNWQRGQVKEREWATEGRSCSDSDVASFTERAESEDNFQKLSPHSPPPPPPAVTYSTLHLSRGMNCPTPGSSQFLQQLSSAPSWFCPPLLHYSHQHITRQCFLHKKSCLDITPPGAPAHLSLRLNGKMRWVVCIISASAITLVIPHPRALNRSSQGPRQ